MSNPGTHEYEQAALCWEKAANRRHLARGCSIEGHGREQRVREAVAWERGAEAWELAGKRALEKAESDS